MVAALNAANFCELVTDSDAPPTNTFQFPGPCKSGLFLQRYWVSGITCHMYSREERTRLTGEINDMSAFIPGAERYFRRSLDMKKCRDRLIISSGFQEKGGVRLLEHVR